MIVRGRERGLIASDVGGGRSWGRGGVSAGFF